MFSATRERRDQAQVLEHHADPAARASIGEPSSVELAVDADLPLLGMFTP